MSKSFKENRLQRFLRTTVWEWRKRRPRLSSTLVIGQWLIALVVAGLLVHDLAPLACAVVVIAAAVVFGWAYSYNCFHRHEQYVEEQYVARSATESRALLELMGLIPKTEPEK